MQATTSTTSTPATQSTQSTTPDKLEWVDKTRDTIDTMRARAESLDTQLRSFAREKPLAAVLCAFAGGYVLARLSTWR